MKNNYTFIVYLIALIICFYIPITKVWAEPIPPHLASFAAKVYKSSKSSLEEKGATAAHKKALERARKIIKKAGVSYWADTKVSIPGLSKAVADTLELDLSNKEDLEFISDYMNKSIDEQKGLIKNLYKTKGKKISDERAVFLVGESAKAQAKIYETLPKKHTLKGDEGERVEVEWRPDTGEVFVRAISDGSGSVPEYDVSLSGNIKTKPDPDTGGADVVFQPAKRPAHVYTKEELSRMRGSIIGEWHHEETGDHYSISATDKKIGDIKLTKEWYEQEIAKVKEKLRRTQNAKEFIWKDPQNGEVIRQKRFRRLKEPYVYEGEKYLIENAEIKIADLEKQIKDLEDERDGKTLPPVDKHDPVDFEKISGSSGSQPITIRVVREDGYSYTYDQASFDGRKVAAKRTYKSLNDLQEHLPMKVRQQLISSWSPPGWLSLEAKLDPPTGKITIEGRRFSLHVTYDGWDHEVSSIHTPYSSNVILEKDTGVYKTAWGAKDKEIP